MSGTVVVGRLAAQGDRWVRPWPLRKPPLVYLAVGAPVLLVVTTGVALLYMTLDSGRVGEADRAAPRGSRTIAPRPGTP